MNNMKFASCENDLQGIWRQNPHTLIRDSAAANKHSKYCKIFSIYIKDPHLTMQLRWLMWSLIMGVNVSVPFEP